MVGGTATLELSVDKFMGKPLSPAEPVSATEHEVDAGPVTMRGLHERPLSDGPVPLLFTTDKLAPDAITGMEVPSAAEAKPDRVTGIVFPEGKSETVKVSVATVCDGNVFLFSPYKAQVIVPGVVLQPMVFPSPTTEDARVATAPVMSAPEYVIVHWRLAG